MRIPHDLDSASVTVACPPHDGYTHESRSDVELVSRFWAVFPMLRSFRKKKCGTIPALECESARAVELVKWDVGIHTAMGLVIHILHHLLAIYKCPVQRVRCISDDACCTTLQLSGLWSHASHATTRTSVSFFSYGGGFAHTCTSGVTVPQRTSTISLVLARGEWRVLPRLGPNHKLTPSWAGMGSRHL